LALKTLLKTCLKQWRNSENVSLKILVKTPKKWGFYRLPKNIVVWLICQPQAGGRLAGRPPMVINMTVGAARSTARRPQIYREQSSLAGRPPGRPAQSTGQTCTDLCTSVDRLVDRLWNTVDRPGRPQGLAASFLGQKTRLKIFLKIHVKYLKIPKNSFIILH